MEIVVKARNIEIPDHYREHVAAKLDKAARLDRKIISIDVELLHERNPRQQDHCQRVELTCRSRGPVVRAEATARDFYSALDEAVEKLSTRLRRAADRRRVHHRPGRPLASVAEATANLPAGASGRRGAAAPATELVADRPAAGARPGLADGGRADGGRADGEPAGGGDEPWRLVREKEHSGTPMTVDDALFEMELVGHDFYLFRDQESGRPSVVYRRKGFDYGVISLAEPAG